jgi:hypothetical protein
MSTKRLKDLIPNPKNPRKATEEKRSKLKKTLDRFGPLDGFVKNRRTDHMISGHRRRELNEDAEIVIVKTFEKPTKKGTVAIGYVRISGERHAYREVDWDETTEAQAMLAANNHGGEWDIAGVSALVREIDEFGGDLDLTLFDKDELEGFMVPTRSPNFEEGSEEDQGQLDRKKPVECPECGHEFVPEAR